MYFTRITKHVITTCSSLCLFFNKVCACVFLTGKFQMQVLPKSGHAVHEDVPEQVRTEGKHCSMFKHYLHTWICVLVLHDHFSKMVRQIGLAWRVLFFSLNDHPNGEKMFH